MKKIHLDYKTTSIILAVALILSNILFAVSYMKNKKYGEQGMRVMKKDMHMKGEHMMMDGKKMKDGDMKMEGMNMNSTSSDMGDMTMNDMADMLKGKSGKNLEKEFISGMVPHHQGAIDMAKVLLQDKTVNPELQNFAKQIITAQESEIQMMNEWLKKY